MNATLHVFLDGYTLPVGQQLVSSKDWEGDIGLFLPVYCFFRGRMLFIAGNRVSWLHLRQNLVIRSLYKYYMYRNLLHLPRLFLDRYRLFLDVYQAIFRRQPALFLDCIFRRVTRSSGHQTQLFLDAGIRISSYTE